LLIKRLNLNKHSFLIGNIWLVGLEIGLPSNAPYPPFPGICGYSWHQLDTQQR
jgi:hypothetical protein